MELSIFSVVFKYEELECFYVVVGKVIYEGFINYEKVINVNFFQFFGIFMIFKFVCSNNFSYIDWLIFVFMCFLQKMVWEYLNFQVVLGSIEVILGISELVMLSLELVKMCLVVMSMEMWKNFIQVILIFFIEKLLDVKIFWVVVKIVEEWVKNNFFMVVNQIFIFWEKFILFVKMMIYIEKCFLEDFELNVQFLDFVNYVYRDEMFFGSELMVKFEFVFFFGLCCVQLFIRVKFFEVFDNFMKCCVYECLLYVICLQNWEVMGNYFWIKQCIELFLVVCEKSIFIGISC